MNKENWLTIILDETINDDTIMELIAESHVYSQPKTKKSKSIVK